MHLKVINITVVAIKSFHCKCKFSRVAESNHLKWICISRTNNIHAIIVFSFIKWSLISTFNQEY